MEHQELKSFYQNNVEGVYKFFYFKTLNREVAEDLTSDVFLRFVDIISTDKEIQSHKAFLYGIVKNVFIQFLKKKYDEPSTQTYSNVDFEEYVDTFTDQHESSVSLEDRVLPYIELLPEAQKLVAKLRFIDKNSLSEIAQMLNKDMNYVKTTQKRAIAKLKDLILCTP